MSRRRHRMFVWFAAVFVASMVGMLALAYLNDRWSCSRSQESRRALNVAAVFVTEVAQRQRARAAHETGWRREADLRSAALGERTARRLHVHQLSCTGIIPGT